MADDMALDKNECPQLAYIRRRDIINYVRTPQRGVCQQAIFSNTFLKKRSDIINYVPTVGGLRTFIMQKMYVRAWLNLAAAEAEDGIKPLFWAMFWRFVGFCVILPSDKVNMTSENDDSQRNP